MCDASNAVKKPRSLRFAAAIALAAYSTMSFGYTAIDYPSVTNATYQKILCYAAPSDVTVTQAVGGENISATVIQPDGGAMATAYATDTDAGAFTWAVSQPNHGGTSGGWEGWSAVSQSILNIENLVIAGAGTGLIPVSFNFMLDGGFDIAFGAGAGSHYVTDAYASSNLSLTVGAAFGDPSNLTYLPNLWGFKQLSQAYTRYTGEVTTYVAQDGFLLDTAWSSSDSLYAYSGIVTAGEMYLPVNTPFTLQLEILTNSTAMTLGGDDIAVMTMADFDNTFGLPIGSRFIDLPEGYRIDSQQHDIIDGCLRGCAITAVPEPSTLAMMALGLGLLAGSVTLRDQKPHGHVRQGLQV